MFGLPDPRPSKAHPEHRAQRKKIEKESPHFEDLKSFGLKAAVLGLMAGLAMYPWQEKTEDHDRKHHPERFHDNDSSKGAAKDQNGGSKSGGNRSAGSGSGGSRNGGSSSAGRSSKGSNSGGHGSWKGSSSGRRH